MAVKSKRKKTETVKKASSKTKRKARGKKLKGTSITQQKRLEGLLKEASNELSVLQPKIEKLEKQLTKLSELRHNKQKLLTLKLSLEAILKNYDTPEPVVSGMSFLKGRHVAPGSTATHPGEIFLPEKAMEEVRETLRRPGSINLALFEAIVYHGGKAHSGQIKAYLVEQQYTTPQGGTSFEGESLARISSRINYLVRKGLVTPDGRGGFTSTLGWTSETT